MAQVQKVEGQIEIKSQAENFFNVWAKNTNLLSQISPDKFSKVELHQGSHFHSIGAITTWYFTAKGPNESSKTQVIEFDEGEKSLAYIALDGSLREHYKSYKCIMQAIPKEKGCLVKWRVEYEMKSDDSPNAHVYLDFLIACTKDIEAHLSRA